MKWRLNYFCSFVCSSPWLCNFWSTLSFRETSLIRTCDVAALKGTENRGRKKREILGCSKESISIAKQSACGKWDWWREKATHQIRLRRVGMRKLTKLWLFDALWTGMESYVPSLRIQVWNLCCALLLNRVEQNRQINWHLKGFFFFQWPILALSWRTSDRSVYGVARRKVFFLVCVREVKNDGLMSGLL